MLEVEKISKKPMKTSIDLHLQEEESTTEPIEELIEVQVDPNKPSRVIKINKGLNSELAQQLVEIYTETRMCSHGHT